MRGPDLSKTDVDNLPRNQSIATRAIITMVVSFTFAVATLGMRMYCGFKRLRKPGWDDGTIILSTICSLIQLIFNAIFIYYGQGRHVFYLSRHQIIQSYKFSQFVIFPFIFCTVITKLSIALMVLRLTQSRWMRYYMFVLIVSLVLINGGCIVILFAFCRPYYASWDITVTHETRWSGRVLAVASSVQGVWSIITDLVCTSTPLIMIWKVQMARSQKIAITILIGFGLVTTGSSVGRCIYYATTTFRQDQTWSGIDLVIWTTLEDNIGIFAANLPSLGFLRKHIENRVRSASFLQHLHVFSSRYYQRYKGASSGIETGD